MSGKKEFVNSSSTRPSTRRKNSEEISATQSLGKIQPSAMSTGVKKVDRSAVPRHDEVGYSRKTDTRDRSLSRTKSELRTSPRSKPVEENPRLAAKKKPVRSASQRILRTTERSRLTEKQASPKRSNAQSAPTNEKSPTIKNEEVDPSKLTLAERVKLFNEKIATEQAIASRNMLYNGNRTARQNWLASRSRTQPVTSEELEAAYKKPLSHYNNRHSMFAKTGEWVLNIHQKCFSSMYNTILLFSEDAIPETDAVIKPTSDDVPRGNESAATESVSKKQSRVTVSKRSEVAGSRLRTKPLTEIIECDREERKSLSPRTRSQLKEGTNFRGKESVATIRNKTTKNSNQIERNVRRNERVNKQVARTTALKKKPQTLTNEVSRISEENIKTRVAEKKSSVFNSLKAREDSIGSTDKSTT